MKKCRKCKKVISWDLADILSGTKETPIRVSRESIEKGLCDECYKKTLK